MFSLRNVSYAYDKKAVFKKLNLELPTQGITALLGPNGSGKSTLLKLLAGKIDPTWGALFYKDEPILGPSRQLVAGHDGIALVRQDTRLLPLHTVRENLNHVLRNESFEDIENEIESLANLLGLSNYLNRKVQTLSGGEQQRVAIAAALASYPEVLLMDEPFSQTDGELKTKLKYFLKEIVLQRNVGIVFVSHEAQDVLSIADHVLVIQEGEIIAQGNPKTMYLHPQNHVEATLLGEGNWLSEQPKQAWEKFWLPINGQWFIRPERIQWAALNASPEFEAPILDVHFYGHFIKIYFQNPFSNERWVAYGSAQEPWPAVGSVGNFRFV